ncbi:MAG: hypothetical protein L7U87_01205 [Chlamydiales bacterium]|nr:hypothetical protein [Chlamydiales bacterium]
MNTLCAFEKSEIPPIVLGAYLISLSYARLLLPDEIRENDRELIDFLIRCLGKVSIYKLDEIEPCYQGVYIHTLSVYASLISSQIEDYQKAEKPLSHFHTLLDIDKSLITSKEVVESYILALFTFADNIFSHGEEISGKLSPLIFNIYTKIASFEADEIPNDILDCYYKSLLNISVMSLEGRGCTKNLGRARYYFTVLTSLDSSIYTSSSSSLGRAIEFCVLQANRNLRSLDSANKKLEEVYPQSPISPEKGSN